MGTLRIARGHPLPRPGADVTRFYQASTSELLWPGAGRHRSERRRRSHPRSPYAVAKALRLLDRRELPREHTACMRATASLFNHETPRRGETFVTRKITRGLANIAQGLEHCLYMGNIDTLRDWGHAKDYVRMQWMMLQQDTARGLTSSPPASSTPCASSFSWSAQRAGPDHLSSQVRQCCIEEVGNR